MKNQHEILSNSSVQSSIPDSFESTTDESGHFSRYKITTQEAPHRVPVPHPFVPKVKKIGLAKLLIKELFEYNFKLVREEYRRALLSRPCIYGVFSGTFGGFNPIEERCVGCMRCVQEYPDTCTVERNPEFNSMGDSYWMSEDYTDVIETPFATVWYEAKTGNIPVKGMGYRGTFAGDGWDSMWTDMSEIVRPTRDGVYGREYISTQVDIGSRLGNIDFTNLQFNYRSLSIPIPIILDHLPSNLNQASILESISKSAQETQTKFIATPQLMKDYNIPVTSSFIPYLKSDVEELEQWLEYAPAVELEENAIHLVDSIRSIKPQSPIIGRMKFNDESFSRICDLVESGFDGIHLVADYHGNTYEGHPSFVKSSLIDLHQQLVREGIRDKLSLLVSGGVILAEHVPKAIICGADAVAINTSLLVALQCQFEAECKTPKESKISNADMDPVWGSQRIVNLLGSWHNQIIEIMSAMGIKEIRRLRGDTGRAMFKEELEEVAFGDITRSD